MEKPRQPSRWRSKVQAMTAISLLEKAMAGMEFPPCASGRDLILALQLYISGGSGGMWSGSHSLASHRLRRQPQREATAFSGIAPPAASRGLREGLSW